MQIAVAEWFFRSAEKLYRSKGNSYFNTLSITSCTTSGFSSVLVSPRFEVSPEAILRSIRRIIFPLRVLVVKRINSDIKLQERDQWLQPLLDAAEATCEPEIMDAEDPLFILYTSGSTGTPKGMVHTTAGYMVYSAFTFKNVFQYREDDVYWCTADIGWITGHSYIVYGPLANGATTVMFEGVPSYPDYGRFWEIVEKHKVTQFYTAPTAIRALAKENLEHVEKYDLSSLKVLGTVGEPINEEAWHWYDENVGKKNCPIVDTWWQFSVMLSLAPSNHLNSGFSKS